MWLRAFLIIAFAATSVVGPMPLAYADSSASQGFALPRLGQMVNPTPAFNSAVLKGIKVFADKPFQFDFIVDPGDRGGEAKDEYTRLIKYFLASLTIPEGDLWVNLSPYEKDRIVPESFGQTEMGRDLLAQDYVLKQLTASVIYPESETGKQFWSKVYKEAQDKYGTTQVPVNTFNKVWIVPEKAVVIEGNNAAYVTQAKLKVMLEDDYLSIEKHRVIADTNRIGTDIVRQIVIPILEKEVNEGANFAQLRQIYNALILATWYKKKIKSSLIARQYVNQKKIAGMGYKQGDPASIYQQYLQAFKKGAYNFIKEETDPATGQIIPRKYFSGGANLDLAMNVYHGHSASAAELTNLSDPAQQVVHVDFKDSAMTAVGPVDLDEANQRIKFNGAAPLDLTFNLLAVRHGETNGNAKGVFQGSVEAVGDLNQLTPQSREDAKRAAQDLFDSPQIQSALKAGKPIVVIRSLLKRSIDTAQPFIDLVRASGGVVIAEEVPAEMRKGANEINFGDISNKAEGDADLTAAQKEFIAQYRGQLNANAKIGDGESFLDLLKRVKDWLEKLNVLYKGQTVVIFGHGTHLSAVKVLLGDKSSEDASGYINWRAHMLRNTVPVVLHENHTVDPESLIVGGLLDNPPWMKDQRYRDFTGKGMGGLPVSGVDFRNSVMRVLKERGMRIHPNGVGLVMGFGDAWQEVSELSQMLGLGLMHGVEWDAARLRKADVGLRDWLKVSTENKALFQLHHADMRDLSGVIDEASINFVYGYGITLSKDDELSASFAKEIVRILTPGGVCLLQRRDREEGVFLRELKRYGELILGDNYLVFKKDMAMVKVLPTGGIDLNRVDQQLSVQGRSEGFILGNPQDDLIKIEGLAPRIRGVESLKSLREFLGVVN